MDGQLRVVVKNAQLQRRFRLKTKLHTNVFYVSSKTPSLQQDFSSSVTPTIIKTDQQKQCSATSLWKKY